MIRNLPRKFIAWDLVKELDLYMDRSAYDFVYVPWDKASLHNMGYGFVNFVDVDLARMAFAKLEGQAWQTGMRTRGAKLAPARVQGLADNLERYTAAGGEPEAGHRPLVFQGGAFVDLTSALRCFCPAAAPVLSSPPSPLSSAADDISGHSCMSGFCDEALLAGPPGLFPPLPSACLSAVLRAPGAKSWAPPTPPTPSLPPQSPLAEAHEDPIVIGMPLGFGEPLVFGPPGLAPPESSPAFVGIGLAGFGDEEAFAEQRACGFYAARDNMTSLLLQMLAAGGDSAAAGCR
mmetsp:Transcript_121582/g.349467  ORF Transcript_121582/g.349467 Transcript_121582/m.349467 type:complete len:290 (+) Transcript_121582:2-871(+)